jgi:geranylgeranyl pyrophosphate synthase
MNYFALVDPDIKRVEEKMRACANGNAPDLQAALDQIVSSGGKRIRPTVVLLASGMFGNSRWSPAATVLAGDYLFARAAELAAATDSVEVMQIFARTLSTIVSGEINQLFESKGLVSRDDYFNRIYAKTASLFETALQTTGIISSVEADTIQSMKRYGYEIGMAFQIIDDILDFTGDQTSVGKPVASDLRHGLITLPAINYLETNPNDQVMRAVFNGDIRDEKRIVDVVDKIRASGAIQQSMREAQQFVDRAIQAINDFPPNQERQALIEIARYIVTREI